jgi:hypothetical protein
MRAGSAETVWFEQARVGASDTPGVGICALDAVFHVKRTE